MNLNGYEDLDKIANRHTHLPIENNLTESNVNEQQLSNSNAPPFRRLISMSDRSLRLSLKKENIS